MYEYKVVPAPLRTVKVKGLKTTEERFAHLIEEALNDEAAGGWEYLRSETLPCEERKGLTGTARSFQSVLVFRRPRMLAAEAVGEEAQAEAQNEAEAPAMPVVAAGSQTHGRQEPLFRAGAALRGEAPRPEPTLRGTAADENDEGGETGQRG